MNVYVVVEGRVVEKAAYSVWIPQINNVLTLATFRPEVVGDNKFFIVSGEGYPQYFDVIHAALEEVAAGDPFHRLVICIDSEDMTLADKYAEVLNFINSTPFNHIDYRIVVQHFCFETWALGNRKIARKHPQDERLLKYRRHYNVLTLDPEGLPGVPSEGLTRSQLAEQYLRATVHDKNRNLTYSKRKPDVVTHHKFFPEVRRRLQETQHIQSFQAFLDAFV